MEYMYADQPNPETYFVNTGNPTVSYDKLINGIIKGPGGTASNDAASTSNSSDESFSSNDSDSDCLRVMTRN